MNKIEEALECLERLKTAPSFMGGTYKYMFSTQSETALLEDYEIVKQALQSKSLAESCWEIVNNKLHFYLQYQNGNPILIVCNEGSEVFRVQLDSKADFDILKKVV